MGKRARNNQRNLLLRKQPQESEESFQKRTASVDKTQKDQDMN